MRDKTINVLIPVSFLPLLLCGVSCDTKFEIAVPTSPQVGVYGQSMVLSCSFPVGGAWDPSSSVILWQRNLEVIHSFYYSRDQLDYQSPHYANRTNLYHSEMERGNASLRLDRTTLEDAGEYTCFVSTQKGSQKKSFSVKIAAFYPEPHMLISLRSSGEVDVLMTSHGGYPSPSLQWFMGDEQDVTNVTLTQLEQDKDTKLYNVNSKLNLTKGINSSITFILRNDQLGQEIRRNIDLFSENGKTSNSSVRGIVGIYVLIGVLITGVALAIVFTVEQWKRRSSLSRVSEGKVRSSDTADCQGVTSKETPTDCATERLVSPA